MKILVTGTPGVGKTRFADIISKRLGLLHLDITAHIKNHKLYESYDEELSTYIFSESVVAEHLKKHHSNTHSLIIDTHSPSIVKYFDFDMIILIRCEIAELRRRLAERGYSKKKITENIDCEIFEVIKDDLDESFAIEPIIVYSSKDKEDDEAYTFDEAVDMLVVMCEKENIKNIAKSAKL